MKRGVIVAVSVELVEGMTSDVDNGLANIWFGSKDDVSARIQRVERVVAEADDLVLAVSRALEKLCGDAEAGLQAVVPTPPAGEP